MNRIIYVFVFMAVSFIYMKNSLHMFQQNRYEFKRFTKWLFSFKNKFYFQQSIIFICLMVSTLFIKKYYGHILCAVLCLIYSIYLISSENKINYIKPLVYTARIKRTIVVYCLFEIVVTFVLTNALFKYVGIVGMLSTILPYIIIYPTALVLKPCEYFIKKKYENEARSILEDNKDLIKIGITGSYGKTTTKNIVTEILNTSYYTLMTPASYNTPMGITRTVREHLKRIHQVFVCEMGADHVNDISYLMKMVKPKIGIVSSIGPQHLNTFGSLDNIINEKMQEIEMLPEDGVGIINLDNDLIATYPIRNLCKVVSVGFNNKNADILATDVKYSKLGTSFKLKLNGKTYKFETKLLGEHNITNILLGIAAALELNIDIKDIVKAVNNLSQVEHRLELKTINGYSFIDDAFNSNPSGCIYALKALSLMPGKRVIVTPGLIDLGKEENNANYNFGKNMINNTDFVILVGKNQTKYIYKGLEDSGYDLSKVLVVDKVYEAFNYVYSHFGPNDTILLENDLPDAFNN